jgi:hypothetical protein
MIPVKCLCAGCVVMLTLATACVAGEMQFAPQNDASMSSAPGNQTEVFQVIAPADLRVGHQIQNSETYKAVISFDVSGLAGQYTSIDSVQLKLYEEGGWDILNGGTINVGIYKILPINAGWVEGDSSGGVTWAYRHQIGVYGQNHTGSTEWTGSPGCSTPGVDYDATPLATFDYLTDNTEIGFIYIDLPVMVIDQWVKGANAGLLLHCTTQPVNDIGFFGSKEAGSYSPALIVAYSYIPPKTCAEVWAAGLGKKGDLNQDCIIDFKDFAEFAAQWLMNNNPVH